MILNVIIIKYNILYRIILFIIFQMLIFNKMLIISIILSLILNINKQILVISDINRTILEKEIKSVYGEILIKKMQHFFILDITST